MNFRGLLNLLALCSLALVLAGCASSPRSGQYADSDNALSKPAIPDPNKPNMFFSGGNVQQVRGAAMGAAVTQGWEIKKAGRDSLILQRDLDDVAAENLAPGASRGPLPPVVEVRTDFFDRSGGVNVQLAAEVVTGRGTNKEARQDYTETYRNELMHSLATLQNDWREAGPKIANALPPIGGMRDNAPADYSDSASGTNPPPDTLSSNPLGDITEGLEEDQPSSASNWTLPPPAAPPLAAATATAAAVARANALPLSKAAPTPLPKAPQAPKGPPPAATVTKMATAPAPSLFTSAPKTSTVPSPKAAPVSTIQVTPLASGAKPTPPTVTKPASAAAGSAKSSVATANTKTAPVVASTPKNHKSSTATTKSATVASTKTPAKVTPSPSSPPVTKAKAVPAGTKSSAASATNSKTTGTATTKTSSVPAKTASAAKPNTSKAKQK